MDEMKMNLPPRLSSTRVTKRLELLASSSLSPVTFALEMRISTEEHFTPPLTSDSDWSAGCHGEGGGRQGPGRGVLAHRSVESSQRYESRRGAGALRPMRTVKVDMYRGYSLAVEHFRTCFLPPKLAPYHKTICW